jgi:hypothetical protein
MIYAIFKESVNDKFGKLNPYTNIIVKVCKSKQTVKKFLTANPGHSYLCYDLNMFEKNSSAEEAEQVLKGCVGQTRQYTWERMEQLFTGITY